MENKHTITKVLLRIGGNNNLLVEYKEVSIHAPINRVLDRVGYFKIDVHREGNRLYMISSEENEFEGSMTKILVSRIDPIENRLVDMKEEDEIYISSIAERWLEYGTIVL